MATFIHLMFFLFCTSFPTTHTSPLHSSIPQSVNSSQVWKNNDESMLYKLKFRNGSTARLVLASETITGHKFMFGCGFYSSPSTPNAYYFAIILVKTFKTNLPSEPQVVWMANRNNPLRENATLTFSDDGTLALRNTDGTIVWHTNATSNKPVARLMILNNQGNLYLSDEKHEFVSWRSFNHPTDTLLLSQIQMENQTIVTSATQQDPREGRFYVLINRGSLSAFVKAGGRRPIVYQTAENLGRSKKFKGIQNLNGGIQCLDDDDELLYFPFFGYLIPLLRSIQFLRLESNGIIKIHSWTDHNGWVQLDIVHAFLDKWDECQGPLACGPYGVCKKGQCSCPLATDGKAYFETVDHLSPEQGCTWSRDVSSAKPDHYRMVEFGALYHFSYVDPDASLPGSLSLEGCKAECSQDKSCKAASFRHSDGSLMHGNCFLHSEVLSFRAENLPGLAFNSSTFIKVPVSANKNRLRELIVRIIIISTAFIIASSALACLFLSQREKMVNCCGKKQSLVRFPQNPKEFTYKELCVATQKFQEKLGEGGFGAVFKGVLRDGTVVAVKRLDNITQGVKEFLAEVRTIGAIHHINVVRLVGFCSENSHRLLVYEYMSKGSLEKWIFQPRQKQLIDWETRKKIILDVARGLAYLHEQCLRQIVHLDVKPHNILIDDGFNAKISDFGLAKLIDKDISHVISPVRGTLGYLAPEWLDFRISVKADTYSFGVMLLEVICGRRHLDYSKTESGIHLLSAIKKKARENRLIDMIDKQIVEGQCDGEEAMRMIRIGYWCSNRAPDKRPPMSTVVRVLEGIMAFESGSSYMNSEVFDSPVLQETESSEKEFIEE
ncbi:G-type lectin S-receptor-like serine/threonine-protein kinase SD2-5 [Acorus gramineus]|uniref:Receptor-like serine/threonine-protein kinase n=1 Tax=Acorus gramineus TaxID=55184 RepID=A0AAV9A1K9_ACOGR|nr:G-type lectin S-receptor-like serine/threonine-protein kinase SD2-5 [Acorus gramineus]